MGPLASQLTGGGRFCSRLATNVNAPLGRPTWRRRSTTGARQRWQRLRRVRPLVRRGAMHVRALAWWRCPLCSASYGISPFCTAFPHLQPYFFFKHPRRRCPALGSRCDNESSAKEPVRAPFGWGGGAGGALGGASFSRGSGCMGGVLCGGCGQASLVQHFPSAPSRPQLLPKPLAGLRARR